ncbi:MAG: hypothetical protein LBR71_05445 [Synergistaceae bacterium]|jgi:hypothetical protein|nr:hypothetical protein [Synergistaceae bacterium]
MALILWFFIPIMLPGIKASVIKAGLYVITQTGDTVKIDVPEDFTPKTW